MQEHSSTIEYRDISGFPGYRVGNDGTVWSCRPKNGHGPLWGSWRLMKPVVSRNLNNPKGRFYKTVQLCRDGLRPKRKPVHLLVLTAFRGPCPNGMQGCHEDGDRFNNVLSNLRWDTVLKNHADKRIHGTMAQGERTGTSKLKAEQVSEIRAMYATGQFKQVELARRFDTSHRNISIIVRRMAWKHIP